MILSRFAALSASLIQKVSLFQPNECSGNWPTTVYIEDTIKIPTDIEAVCMKILRKYLSACWLTLVAACGQGEYVLGWRWCAPLRPGRSWPFSPLLTDRLPVLAAGTA